MSKQEHSNDTHELDPAEAIIGHIPVLLPALGALLIFLLAFITVAMT